MSPIKGVTVTKSGCGGFAGPSPLPARAVVRRIEFRANRHEVRRSCRAALIEEVRFARDSPLEGDGFEPSVPREKDGEKAKESISHKTASAEGLNRAVPTKHPFLAGIEWRYPSGIRCQRVCRFRRRR